ncbi:DNA-directed DNA polymerase alpha catalytic subunit pol1 [Verticillium nonalfalfae]|uniref:DNA polymerase n=1 Tax=Verticillium nonalfalfae TaxID=1051616 RepID=A0A3M9XXX0_9PEZI|nr:DNA-directed DNA polymerase alpha catalytic subunit pol1 [Verticillium nonalfalfae]RNJ52622.1 DNA-directed DNA polymerase alpha catalytic subunit pol1 [Verticillium nonalfalfae]
MGKTDRRAKLAELKALRQAGKKAFDNYQVDDINELYEEVDETQYKKIVRDRLNEDDFVVDDNGEGYADDGREEWDRVQQYHYASDSEEDGSGARGRPTKASKKKQADDAARREANDRDISTYFTSGAGKTQAKPKVAKTKEDDDFLADLLGEVDTNVPAPVPRSTKRHRSPDRQQRRVRVASPPPHERSQPLAKRSKIRDDRPSSPPAADDMLVDDNSVPTMDDDELPTQFPMGDPAPSSPAAKVAERKAQIKKEPDDDDDDMMEVAHAGTVTAASVNITGSRPPKKLIKPEPYPAPITSSPVKQESAIDPSAWNDITNNLNIVSNSVSEVKSIRKIDYKDAIEEDGSLNMFWTDYTEVSGSLCLFGKVLNKKTGQHVSCFVKIDNILRKLFFLPRETRVQGGIDTCDEVGMVDVYSEVDALMTKMKIGKYKTKSCNRKYAFELPDIPKEGQYLKCLYPYSMAPVDAGETGETFSHVFGTNTALFEQFVLWKNIMGPCWLNIKDADFSSLQNASHCKLEVLVEHPNMVASLRDSENLDTPPLTLMSLAMRTTFNAKDNKLEILALSARVYEKVSLSDTTPAEKLPCRTFTLVRPNGSAFPGGFEKLAKDRSNKGLIKTFKQESEILMFFLAQLDIVDPDVILGHQLEGVDYSVLLNRIHEKKTPQWSRLGRLRRTVWPSSIGKTGGNVFAERQVMSGRLLCDLANDAGKSAMYKCQSWSLTEMCSLYLSGNNHRRELDNDAALKTWASHSKEGFMDYVTHIEADTYFIAALALQVQLLPLTKVLTNLAGNSWARTLTGTRAERNEYILLHEFHRNKYICPDKQGFQRGKGAKEDEEGDSKKKDKFKGGLVFDPEKGLYDKFVLVMDFNSLYPSIIQEFNICFTTVDRTAKLEDEEEVPEVPVDQEQGILPKLIATLVSRRKQVKSLMKDKTATPEQLATWDIKQLALKLTANSMYGCLGYTKSRFYARPLAVLTTYKGREILRSTKELAESRALQVIYGDTDSVMINANVENVADAFKVGAEFKKAVNERYRLLEIDIDNVFRRILLQAKKKYAAINLVENNGKYIEKMEVKGLDMKRREYCGLSKEISGKLLDEILSGEDTEVSISRIHDYLREIAAKMREQSIPAQKYIIFTQLGKGPKEYPNGDTMPQVQVALRDIARGKNVRKGDVISYIITGDGQSSEPAPKRAYTPSDVLKPESGLAPDVEWYIAKQIFPPVERLCANIVGTSTMQLAECLGLDIKRYDTSRRRDDGVEKDMEVHPLESQIPDDVRFADCTRLSLRCRTCKKSSVFEGLYSQPTRVSPAGVLCDHCGATISPLSVVAQVEHAIRVQTARYYEGWLICDDSSCGIRTRQMNVYGTRCLGPKGLARDCLGRMRYDYSEKAIYNQLVYFTSLWDVDKARDKAIAAAAPSSEEALSQADRENILALAEHNRVRFGTVKGVVDKYLDKCGRQWVAMDTLFAKLGFSKALAPAA